MRDHIVEPPEYRYECKFGYCELCESYLERDGTCCNPDCESRKHLDELEDE